uniref:ADP-ribosylation factor GTPase-activating protein AGD3 n=1 Tax=Oryza rufipogon TaxID=4529 RepID=A0A0E0QTL3_ORYRU
MFFTRLDDSPMFRKQIQSLEEGSELLRERCLRFHKGCRKYTEGLGEAYDGDIAFASSLEAFGGGHNDPISVAFGGPVMTKFTIALREIGTYKEVLRSQVENMLNDKLLQFVDIDLHDVKDARKRFDKASLLYDQARERYLSLKKGTRTDVATAVEDELHSARSSFEQARFNLVTALSNIEAKKRFEFLEAVSGTMDAHLRYFKQGYELLHQMEPYINQVLAYAQQSRERSNYEQAALVERMQEFKRQIDRESRWSPNGINDSPNGDGIQAIGRSSHKMIEAVMQSASKGKVQTIRQGYLSKRSSNLRGDWKRRFFVLDSRGMLYYYRKQNSRPSSGYTNQRSSAPSEHGSGLLSRWFSSHYHGGVHDEKSVARHTVNLLTSTIKADADQSDLRFCFRIISPTKNYTLQAESAMDQMDWIEKITGVIASLLSSQSPERRLLSSPKGSGHNRTASESSSFSSSTELDHSISEDCMLERNSGSGYFDHSGRAIQHHRTSMKPDKPIDLLRKVVGNNICADCGAAEPDWASLNLGILLCIECSGVHRNLGVHISKVRSLTLDVRVWEASVINLFQSLGNTFANTIWEDMLPSSSSVDHGDNSRADGLENTSHNLIFSKPKHSDHIAVKEKFIHAKYAERDYVRKLNMDDSLVAQQMWENVSSNNKKGVYSLIVGSNADVNLTYGQTSFNSALTLGKALLLQEQPTSPSDGSSRCFDRSSLERISPRDSLSLASTSARIDELDDCVEGLSLLHLACRVADVGMVELLLQYGANVNSADSRGRTPLHHSILKGRHMFAKLLLSRGADSQATDRDGRTALQYAIDSGTIDDEEILVLLEDPSR